MVDHEEEREIEIVSDLNATAQIGMTVDDFMRSDVGRYLVGMAKMESDIAQKSLNDTDPHDWRVIQKLQEEIRITDKITSWLQRAIEGGERAIDQLTEREQPGD